jgi:hypothetical protein
VVRQNVSRTENSANPPCERLNATRELKPETVLRAKEARNMAESYSRTLVETTAAMLLIPKSAGVLADHRDSEARRN